VSGIYQLTIVFSGLHRLRIYVTQELERICGTGGRYRELEDISLLLAHLLESLHVEAGLGSSVHLDIPAGLGW
jgi:hypothetical protein